MDDYINNQTNNIPLANIVRGKGEKLTFWQRDRHQTPMA